MNNRDLPIYFSPHAIKSMQKRGATQDEIIETIRESSWRQTKLERLEAEKEFDYNNKWNNKFYKFKKVNPVFVIDNNQIIVITVYCFYY